MNSPFQLRSAFAGVTGATGISRQLSAISVWLLYRSPPRFAHAESDLGECYEQLEILALRHQLGVSLANVQLPSRNHALQAAYARM